MALRWGHPIENHLKGGFQGSAQSGDGNEGPVRRFKVPATLDATDKYNHLSVCGRLNGELEALAAVARNVCKPTFSASEFGMKDKQVPACPSPDYRVDLGVV